MNEETAEVDKLRAKMLAKSYLFNKDELELIVDGMDRLEVGLKSYGHLNIDEDKRHFPTETYEEIIDAEHYIGALKIILKRLMGGQR